MRLNTLGIVACASFAFTAVAHAQNLSYTNVDVGFLSTELGDTSINGDGIQARGSLAVNENVFVTADISDIGYEHSVDGLEFGVGVGGHMPLNNKLDLVGQLAVMRQKVDVSGGGSNSENGYRLAGTVRTFVMPQLELQGGVQHEHYSDSGSTTGLVGEGRYFFTNTIAGGVQVELGDATTFGVYARFTF